MNQTGWAYWLCEFLVIAAADLGAGWLILRFFERRQSNREKAALAHQMCRALESVAGAQRTWVNGVNVRPIEPLLIRKPGAYYGLDLLVTNLGNWNFDDSDSLRTLAEVLLGEITAWEQQRNNGLPSIGVAAMKGCIQRIGEAADSLHQGVTEFRNR